MRPGVRSLRNAAGELELVLIGGVGDPGEIELEPIARALQAFKGRTIRVLLDSPGGLGFTGISIFNLLRDHPAKKVITIGALAASAGAIIAAAGDQVLAHESSLLFIHACSGVVVGNSKDMAAGAESADRLDRSIAIALASKCGHPVDVVRAAMLRETWFSAREAMVFGPRGLVDGLIDDAVRLPLAADLRQVQARTGCRRLPAIAARAAVDPVSQARARIAAYKHAGYSEAAATKKLATEDRDLYQAWLLAANQNRPAAQARLRKQFS